jgi:hypothetical protein
MAEQTEQVPNAGTTGEKTEQTQQTQTEKVEFSEVQQRKVNDLIDQTFAKAFEKAEQKWQPKITELETKIQALSGTKKDEQAGTTSTKSESKTEKKETKTVADETLEQVKAQLAEFRNIAEQLKQEKADAEKRASEVAKQNKASKIKEEYIKVSDKVSFFDRMSEFSHMEGQLELDDNGSVVVLNPQTKMPRLNTNLQPMSLEEFVQDYAKQKPWTVKAKDTEVAGGSGAGETRKFETREKSQKPADYSKMSLDDLLKEAEKVIAKQYER